MDEDRQLQKLQQILEIVNKDYVDPEEFVQAFEVVLKLLATMKEDTSSAFDDVEEKVKSVEKTLNQVISAFNKKFDELTKKDDSEMKQKHEEMRQMCDQLMQEMDSMKESMPTIDMEAMKKDLMKMIPEQKEETPEETVDKVNQSKKLIKKEKIEGLSDLERITKINAERIYTGISETRALELIRSNTTSTGTGAVDSVNGQTGVVVLDADDISDTATTHKFVTSADLTKLSNLSGTNTGDQDLSGYLTSATASSTYQPLDTQLTDLAGLAYTGNGGKYIRVKATEDGWEFATVSGSGATTALDNLASVAINTDLLLGTSDGGALGSGTKMWSDLFLASGGVINWNNGNVTLTHSSGILTTNGQLAINRANNTNWLDLYSTTSNQHFYVYPQVTTGNLSFYANAADRIVLEYSTGNTYFGGAIISPVASDGAALGSSSLMWSDLFLASGGVINFNNGDMLLTHSTDKLTVTGGEFAVSRTAYTVPAYPASATMASFYQRIDGGNANTNYINASSNTLQLNGAGTYNSYTSAALANGLVLNGTTSLAGSWSALNNNVNVSSSSTASTIYNTFISTNFDNSNTITNYYALYVDGIQGSGSGGTGVSNIWGIYQASNVFSNYFAGLTRFGSSIVPHSSDGAALGSSSLMWSDLFLASGAVINFNNGNFTITHSAGALAFSGSISASNLSGTNTGDQTSVSGNAGTATALQNTRTIWGQNFNGTANVTGDITLGTGNITMTGSIGATGARVTKGWFTDGEFTNMPTVGGTALLTSLTAPQFTTIELGHATDTTLSRVSAGVIAVEGVTIPTISSTNTLTNKRITKRVASTTDSATATIDCDSYDEYYLTAIANNTTISVSGTPTNGQEIFIGLKDAGVSKTLTWTSITGLGQTLPTATTAGKQHIIKLKYIASAWRAIAVNVEA